MSGYRIDHRDVRRKYLLTAASIAALAGAAFLMLHTIATMEPPDDAARGKAGRTNPQAGVVPQTVAGIFPSWLILALNLILTGIFAVSCCRRSGRRASKPPEAEAAGRGAGGIGCRR